MSKIIICHHSDVDGIVGGLLLDHLLSISKECNVERIRCEYSDDMNHLVDRLDSKTDLYIVDFSLEEELINTLSLVAKSITMIDHHPRTQKYLDRFKDMHNIEVYHSKHLCGAEMVFKYFYPHDPIPELLELIGSYDTWRWPNTSPNHQDKVRKVQSFLESIMEGLESYRDLEAIGLDMMLAVGYFKFLHDKEVMMRSYLSTRRSITFKGYKLIIYKAMNCPSMEFYGVDMSSICDGYIFYSETKEGIKCSVRSFDSEVFSARKMAESYGGGGHEHAAGCTLTLDEWEELTKE